jgi:Fe-S oxidoreductase/nitrate reductase gamma subunit
VATRTIFFRISPGGQALFYVLAVLAVLTCFYGFWRRFRLWRRGRPVKLPEWRARVGELIDQVLAHRRIRRRALAGAEHALIFYGMAALFVGTNIVAVEHYGALVYGEHWLYKGAFYLACKLTLDVFGLGLLIAVVIALLRRHIGRRPSLGHDWRDDAFLSLLFAATLTGFLLEGAGLAADPHRAAFAAFSPVGSLFAGPVSPLAVSSGGYAALWWIHAPLVLGVIAALPYGRWLHLFVIPFTIVLKPERTMGALEPLNMAEVEEAGTVGLGSILDLDRWQLMSLDGCMECGRCTDACPAHAVGKVLDPKRVVLNLRSAMDLPAGGKGDGSEPQAAASESTDVVSDEALWACTNCYACVRECPALIRHVDLIDGIRRYRVAEGRLSGPPATMLRQLSSRENPWSLPAAQRADWAKELDIPAAAADDGREVLLWVGCAGALEPRAQGTTRALAELLKRAGVRFSILGPRERCTGDPARRTGDELQFHQLAEANIATLDSVGAKRIVTQCPHCMHTLKNEYPSLGGNYDVVHHTQFLETLVSDGRLKLSAGFAESVTYHDPCFLARVNGETEAPRSLLGGALSNALVEPERRGAKTFCCGAGGGRMWMEEPPDKRPGVERARELMGTGADVIAVGCPFCKVMVGDCAAQAAADGPPPVLDVAEVLLAALDKATL